MPRLIDCEPNTYGSASKALKDTPEENTERNYAFGNYKVIRDKHKDRLCIINLNVEQSDETRETNDYEDVTLYENCYTGDAFKIKIDSFWAKSFHLLLDYMLVVHFDMTQAKAIELAQCVKRL